MKSFFKKLSFVMALAMVVSMVAPAGSVFAATAGIAKQGTTEVVTELNVEVGKEVVDFCFLGAPTDWKTTYKWTSSNPDVATVDTAGKVTALKNGVADITITAGADASYKHTVKVTVGTGVDAAYTIAQKSDTVVALDFGKAVTYTTDDVNLWIVYKNANGEDIEVSWPVKEAKADDNNKNVLNVTPYLAFNDGDRYFIQVGATERQEFTTTIGAVTGVEFDYASLGVNGVAYSNGDEGEDIDVTLSYKLYSGSVDVTNVYKNVGDVTFELISQNEETVSLQENEGVVTFYEIGETAIIRAIYTYTDENGDDQSVPGLPLALTSVAVPAFEIAMEKWMVVDNETTVADIDWAAPNHEVPAGDEGYKVVALLKDNRGQLYVTDVDFVDAEDEIIYLYDANSEFDELDYTIEFNSTNPDLFLVDPETGVVATYTDKKTAVAYISLYDEEKEFVKNIDIIPLTIGTKRVFTHINKGTSINVSLMTDALDTPYADEYTKTKVELWMMDQYYDGAKFKEWTATSNNKKVNEAGDTYGLYQPTFDAAGYSTDSWLAFEIFAENILAADPDASSVTYTLKESSTGITCTIKVSLRDPKYTDHDSNAETPAVINVNGWDVKVDSVNTSAYKNSDDVWCANTFATININKKSGSYAVGRFDATIVSSEAELDSYFDYETNAANLEAGDKFVVVYDPEGNVLVATDGALGLRDSFDGDDHLKINTSAPVDGEMKYMADGKYTVEVYTVTSIDTEKEKIKTSSKKVYFSLSHSIPEVKFVKVTDVKSDSTNPTEIVAELFKFTRGGADWDFTEAMIANVETTELADRIIINSVTFKAPIDGATNAAFDYVTVSNINKSIKITQ